MNGTVSYAASAAYDTVISNNFILVLLHVTVFVCGLEFGKLFERCSFIAFVALCSDMHVCSTFN